MPDLFGNADPAKTTNPAKPSGEAEIIPASDESTNYHLISDLAYKGKPIRRAKLEDGTEVWVVTDVIGAVTDSKNPTDYWYRVKRRMKEEGSEISTNCRVLKIQAQDGKYYDTQVMTLPQLLRMLQSLPSKKAEPFRVFMAEAGYALIKEAQNPDLAIKRGYANYLKKGMSPEKAMKRARGVLARNNLTEQWKRHGVSDPKEYALLTDRESKGTFGKATGEMKKEKGLAKVESLRDSMSIAELLAQEVSDTAISLLIGQRNPYGYEENAVQVDKGSQAGARVLADLNRLLGA